MKKIQYKIVSPALVLHVGLFTNTFGGPPLDNCVFEEFFAFQMVSHPSLDALNDSLEIGIRMSFKRTNFSS